PRAELQTPFADFDGIFSTRIREADEFYAELQHGIDSEDARRVQRQAFAGMIWSKQFFHFDVPEWLNGDPGQPPPPEARHHGRNGDWMHQNKAHTLAIPERGKYPW